MEKTAEGGKAASHSGWILLNFAREQLDSSYIILEESRFILISYRRRFFKVLIRFRRFGTGKGFTLIELLIVIAIILILIAIALPNFLEAQIRARVTKAKSELRTLDTAMQSYFLDWETYPAEHERNETNRMQRGFSWITTPIAYITTMLQDPFAEFSQDQDDTTFITYESGGIEKGGSPFPDCGGICMSTWVMFSNGPDSQQNINAANATVGQSLYNYSPTNGTKSLGELFKWGGDSFWIGVATNNGNAEKVNLTGANNISGYPGLTVDDRIYLHTMPENK